MIDETMNYVLPKEELERQLTAGEVPFFELANDTLPTLIEGYQLGKALEEY